MQKCSNILKRLPALLLLVLLSSLELASASHGHEGYEQSSSECAFKKDNDCPFCEYQLLILAGLPSLPAISKPESILNLQSEGVVKPFTSPISATKLTRGPPALSFSQC